MTNETKQQIKNLRKQGYGYKKISKFVGESVGSVRHYLATYQEKELHVFCLNCGRPIVSIKGKKKKKFCSDRCRWDYWNHHQKEVNKKAYYQVTCKYCGKEFLSYGNEHRVYCCHECYIEDYKHKRKVVSNGQ